MFNRGLIGEKFLFLLCFQIFGFLQFPIPALAIHNPPLQLNIQADQENVNISAKEISLGELLHEIHERTGIQFKIPEPLKKVPVDINILERDWKSALEKLFQENSRIEKWGKNLATSKIWLYEYENHPVSSGDFIVRVDAKENLSKQEILRLARGAKDIEKRLMAIEHFSYLGEEQEVLALLLQSLEASDKRIRSTSIELLKNLTEPLPLPNLGKVSQLDPDPEIRRQALSLITERADEDSAKPLLLQALNDPSIETQNLAQELLSDLGFLDT